MDDGGGIEGDEEPSTGSAFAAHYNVAVVEAINVSSN
jgi:hypothetical protein